MLDQEVYCPTKENVLRFFELLLKNDLLDTLKLDFYPSEEEGSWIHSYLNNIDRIKEFYSIEYDVSVEDVVYEDEPGNPILVPDRTERRIVIYKFEETLYNIVAEQVSATISLTNQALEQSGSIEQSRNLCHLWLNRLSNYQKIAGTPAYKQYPFISDALQLVSNHLQDSYADFCPASTPIIAKTFSKRLKITLAQALVELEYQDEPFVDTIENSEKDVKQTWISILRGKPHGSPVVVNCLWGAEAVSYLLSRIKDYHSLVVLKILEDSKILTIKGKPFLAANAHKNNTKFKKSNSPLKDLIDKTIDEHYS